MRAAGFVLTLVTVSAVPTTTNVSTGGEQENGRERLWEWMFRPGRYNVNLRPVRNSSRPVHVFMRMNLYQILDVGGSGGYGLDEHEIQGFNPDLEFHNEPNQNVALYTWVTQFWSDEFLGWDPAQYDNITYMILPFEKVWLPDTVLYNSVEMMRQQTERYISIIYTTNTSSGLPRPKAEAKFMYPAIYRYSCKMDTFLFPFDTQNCTMTFSSWVWDTAGIDYFQYEPAVTFESFVENEEWTVLSFEWEREVLHFNCCPNPWTLLHAHLVIKRKSLYYVANLVMPTGIITFVAVIGFFTPGASNGERTEKVNLGITTLLAMSIQLLMVSDKMPTTSNFVPLMEWFFLSIIGVTSVGTIMTSIVIVVHQQHLYGKRVPHWVRLVFFKVLGPLVFVTPTKDLETRYKNFKPGLEAFKRWHMINSRGGGTKKRKTLRLRLSHMGSDGEEDLMGNGAPPQSRPKKGHTASSNNSPSTSPPAAPRRSRDPHSPFATNYSNSTKPQVVYVTESKGGVQRRLIRVKKEEPREETGGPWGLLRELAKELRESLEGLRHAIANVDRELVELEWSYLADILDRILLIIFASAVLTLTFGMMFSGSIFT